MNMEGLDMNGGYVGKSISRRAFLAYRKGLMTLSQINAAVLKEYGIPFQVGFFKWLVANQYLVRTEWHHTGPNMQRTDFYAMDEIVEQAKELDVFELFAAYQAEKKKAAKGMFVKAILWNGEKKTSRLMGFVRGKHIHFVNYPSKRVDAKEVEVVQKFTGKPKTLIDYDANVLLLKAKVKQADFKEYGVSVKEVTIPQAIEKAAVKAPIPVAKVIAATTEKADYYEAEQFYWVSLKNDPKKTPVPALLIGNFAYTRSGKNANLVEVRLHSLYKHNASDKGWMKNARGRAKNHKINAMHHG